jgi:hypothetical protein
MGVDTYSRAMRRLTAVICLSAAFGPLILLSTVSPALASNTIPTCSFRQLEVAVAWGPGAAAGNIGIPFIIVNVSRSSCTLTGYPKLSFVPNRYKGRSIKVTHNAGMIYGHVTPRLVTIKPDGVATFGLNFGDASNQNDPIGAPCIVQNIYVALPVRAGTYNQNFETTVNFNFCFADFLVGVTAIQSGPLPKEG